MASCCLLQLESMTPELTEVRMAGSLLAALLREVASRADDRDSEGLLVGATHTVVTAVTEDNQEATESEASMTDVAAFACTGCQGSFYTPTADVKFDKVEKAVCSFGKAHRVVGWYVARHKLSPRPSIRDIAILRSLQQILAAKALADRDATSGSGSQDPLQDELPMVLVVISIDLDPERNSYQTFDYGCFRLSSHDMSSALNVPVRVRNISHDSTLEYRAYVGGYLPSLLTSPASSSSDQQPSQEPQAPGSEIGIPMNPCLANLASAVPPPHIVEMELYFDQVMERLYGLVDQIRDAERDLTAQLRRRAVIKELLQEQKEEESRKQREEEPVDVEAEEDVKTEGKGVEGAHDEGMKDVEQHREVGVEEHKGERKPVAEGSSGAAGVKGAERSVAVRQEDRARAEPTVAQEGKQDSSPGELEAAAEAMEVDAGEHEADDGKKMQL